MTRISRRECLITGLRSGDVDVIIEDLKAYLRELELPGDCTVTIHKDYAACCGAFPIGLAVEIEGSDAQVIEDLDRRLIAKIIEICERRGIDDHQCEPINIL